MSSEGVMTIGCYLHPLENLQFRDGRPLEAGFLHRSQLPTPQTLAGAIRAALMRAVGIDPKNLKPGPLNRGQSANEQTSEQALRSALGQFNQTWIANVRLRGPWLVRHYPARWNRPPELMLPLPAALQFVQERKEWIVLRPLADMPDWMSRRSETQPTQPLWHWQTEPAEPVSGFLTHQAMGRFLRPDPDKLSFEDFANHRRFSDWFATREDLVTDVRAIGIARDQDRSAAKEGRIYAPGELSFPQGLDDDGRTTFSVSFYAEVVVPQEHRAVVEGLRILTFGGQGAEVSVEIVAPAKEIFDMQVPRRVIATHTLIVATSPVITDSVWPPALLKLREAHPETVKLVSACAHGVLPVSGWDAFRRCPHPNRFAAPAGSCYFLTLDSPDPDQLKRAKEQLESLDSLCDEPFASQDKPFASQGWGTFAIGSYRPVELNYGSGGPTPNLSKQAGPGT